MWLDYLALIMLIFGLALVFYTFIFIHDIPYQIALKNNHPQVEAIHIGCWLSLFTLHALWPQLRYVALTGLAAGVCVAVLMVLLFRLGMRKGTRQSFTLAHTTLQDVTNFLEQQGRLWGTRRAPVRRAESKE